MSTSAGLNSECQWPVTQVFLLCLKCCKGASRARRCEQGGQSWRKSQKWQRQNLAGLAAHCKDLGVYGVTLGPPRRGPDVVTGVEQKRQ